MLPESIAPELISVPFSYDDVYGGLATASGLVQATRTELKIQFELKAFGLEIGKSPVQEIVVPLAGIAAISLKKSFLGSALIVRAHNLHTFKDVPGHQQGQIQLGIARRDVPLAERLVSTLMLSLSEQQLHQIESRLNVKALESDSENP